ncbi:MAG: aldolase/citrate lyase family protein [Clostridia bacterium]|nr:aldolase/citrate lyase family protein [Clostridia bacterium]
MRNKVKEMLANGQQALGTFYELGGTAAAEGLAIGGLDFFIIDTEHGPYDVESARDAVLAAGNHDITPFVRVKDTTRPSILKMLDIGAKGLIVPDVRTVQEVEALVEYAKYDPLGRRGFAPVRASAWGYAPFAQDTDTLFRTANEETLLIPQCETEECLRHIDEIAAMPGVDGIFIGPYDLSVALGKPAQMDDPELVSAIAHVLSVCHSHKKIAMIYAGDPARAKRFFADGFDCVACGMDAIWLIDAVKRMAAEARA